MFSNNANEIVDRSKKYPNKILRTQTGNILQFNASNYGVGDYALFSDDRCLMVKRGVYLSQYEEILPEVKSDKVIDTELNLKDVISNEILKSENPEKDIQSIRNLLSKLSKEVK